MGHFQVEPQKTLGGALMSSTTSVIISLLFASTAFPYKTVQEIINAVLLPQLYTSFSARKQFNMSNRNVDQLKNISFQCFFFLQFQRIIIFSHNFVVWVSNRRQKTPQINELLCE